MPEQKGGWWRSQFAPSQFSSATLPGRSPPYSATEAPVTSLRAIVASEFCHDGSHDRNARQASSSGRATRRPRSP